MSTVRFLLWLAAALDAFFIALGTYRADWAIVGLAAVNLLAVTRALPEVYGQ